MGWDTFHQSRLLGAPSSRALNTARMNVLAGFLRPLNLWPGMLVELHPVRAAQYTQIADAIPRLLSQRGAACARGPATSLCSYHSSAGAEGFFQPVLNLPLALQRRPVLWQRPAELLVRPVGCVRCLKGELRAAPSPRGSGVVELHRSLQ